MDTLQRIAFLKEELQVLAFNLADKLETLNFHSPREAVQALQRERVFDMVEKMQKMIRDLSHNLRNSAMDDYDLECREMYSLLDVARRCSVEPGSFNLFVETLIPLLERLNKWGEQGPAPDAPPAA